VILLDTNYLIGLLVPGSEEAGLIEKWHAETELCTSSVAWYEFLSGPVDDEGVEIVYALIGGRVIPFTADQAAEAARLYNAAGRVRGLRADVMIAAAAVVANAELATANAEGFLPFEAFGLRLRK